MPLFSQRKGITPLKKKIQLKSIDDDLKNSLWSAIHINLWQNIQYGDYGSDINVEEFDRLFIRYWISLFKKPADSRPESHVKTIRYLRSHFFGGLWYEVYDFIEFTLKNCPDEFRDDLRNTFNMFMKRENSGYRIIKNQVTEITSDAEIEEIEKALQSPFDSVRNHIETSLGHLSSRENPDYRNSIKESISAVEAIARVVTENPTATLGQLIKKLESNAGIHPALKKAFSSLYGYTSDEGGIRHSMMDEDNITKAEAAFMLVTCSAFVNYVVTKVAENGDNINN